MHSDSDSYDEGSDFDPTDTGQREVYPRERHEDHWDELDEYSPWRQFEDGGNWFNNFVHVNRFSFPSNTLYQDQAVKDCLRTLSVLRPEEYPTLIAAANMNALMIPLFKDSSNGDEYQCRVTCINRLTSILCPTAGAARGEELSGLVSEIRLGTPLMGEAEPLRRVPKYVIPLGTLQLRTGGRYPDIWRSRDFITETMDYHIMIDVGNQALPVWILTSRIQLRDHVEEDGDDIPQLPIFRGLMMNDEYGYHAACILSSVHQLNDSPSAEPDFEKVLRLVSKTRSAGDPRAIRVTKEKEASIFAGADSVEAKTVAEALRAAEDDRKAKVPSGGGQQESKPRWWRLIPQLVSDKVAAFFPAQR